MSPTPNPPDADVEALLDRMAALSAVQSNCLFQLALMVARIAVEPGADAYKEETAQALMGLIRAKPKANVLRLFGAGASPPKPKDGLGTVISFSAQRRSVGTV